jgi:hypothetical protein
VLKRRNECLPFRSRQIWTRFHQDDVRRHIFLRSLYFSSGSSSRRLCGGR